MDLTVQLIIRNNKSSITQTIQSIRPLKPNIIVADVGSDDGTTDLCRRMGCQVVWFEPGTGHDEIRNALTARSNTEWQMCLQPWEVLTQGYKNVASTKAPCQTAMVVQDSTINHEARIWKKSANLQFRNPVYEHLDAKGERSPVCLYSAGGHDYVYNLSMVQAWKSRQPTARDPHYYHAITLLALKQYDSFMNASEHYMFMDQRPTTSSILNRYYYAIVQVIHKQKARPAFQNLNLCIAARPLMAEFWCLTGDIYYHLYNKFAAAKEFYENALLLGSRKLADDDWPMDISKYDEYPRKMMGSCDSIMKKNATYSA